MGLCISKEGINSKDDIFNRGMEAMNPSSSSTNYNLPDPTVEILQNLKKISFKELKIATRNFESDSILGEGDMGTVYKGWIDGIPVAVKRLDPTNSHSMATHIKYLGKLDHPNILKLIGYCFEGGNYRLLVYEFMSGGSLDNHFFWSGFEPLPWEIRLKIAIGAAKGLTFLHSKNVVHGDFKISDILLDSNYNVKLSNFYFAKDEPIDDDQSYFTTWVNETNTVMGSYGYTPPIYVPKGQLDARSDVYKFGVVLLTMLSRGTRPDSWPYGQDSGPCEEYNVPYWAKPFLINEDGVSHIFDPQLEGQHFLENAQKLANLALHCLNYEPKFRPDMDDVVTALQGIQNSN